MSEVGYVRVHRALLGHPAFRNDAESMAFAWLVLRASWRPVRVRYKERTIDLKRGQLAVSVRDMASALDRDKAWIERLWKRLKSETMIETVSETGVTVVTICKYDDYQAPSDTGETPTKTPRKTRARQGQDTEQRREEGKKEESNDSSPPNPQTEAEIEAAAEAARLAAEEADRKAKADAARPVRITADWQPAPLPASIAALVDLWPPGRLDREIEQFRDYWLDRTDKRPGWDRTFHNRIRDVHDKVLRDNRHAIGTDNRPRNNRREGDGFTRAIDRARDAIGGGDARNAP